MYTKYLLIIILAVLSHFGFSQNYIPADPFYMLQYEKKLYSDSLNYHSTILRPVLLSSSNLNKWQLKARSELFYNTNAPNLENTSDRWIGKGTSHFLSMNISFNSKYFFTSIEPFTFISQNLDYNVPNRYDQYITLNDNQPHIEKPYIKAGLREIQIFLKYKEFGIGWSNANMWWGDGLHNSLMMTNNTTGFEHLSIGTVREKRLGNFGVNFKYIFSKLGKYSTYNPYYNSFGLFFSHNAHNKITIGLIKSIMLGGSHPNSSQVSTRSALFSVFSDFGINIGKNRAEVVEDWTDDDNTVAGYISLDIPKEKLKLFFEFGRTDWIWDFKQFLVFPEVSMAFNIGLRKYGIFNKNIFFSIEYISTKINRLEHINYGQSLYYKASKEYNSYNGRKFVAHSGYDADDLLISIGWIDDKISIIPSFNYERHGSKNGTSTEGFNMWSNDLVPFIPETKLEFKIDVRYLIKEYLFNINIEREWLHNLESQNKIRKGFVIWFGVERDLMGLFKK